MDLPLCLEQLTKTGRLLPSDDWGPHANTGDAYADFAKGWRGKSLVPTQAELAAAWAIVAAAQRKPRPIADIVTSIKALTGVEANKLALAIQAAYLVEHPGFARTQGIAVDGDQPA